MNINDVDLIERVMALETKMEFLIGMVDEIKCNHLAHLSDDIKALESKFTRLKSSPSWSVTIIITFLCSLTVALLTLLLK